MKSLISIGLALLSIFELNVFGADNTGSPDWSPPDLNCDSMTMKVGAGTFLQTAMGICLITSDGGSSMDICQENGDESTIGRATFASADCSGDPIGFAPYSATFAYLATLGLTVDVSVKCCTGNLCPYVKIADYNKIDPSHCNGPGVDQLKLEEENGYAIDSCIGNLNQPDGLKEYTQCNGNTVTYNAYNGVNCDGTPSTSDGTVTTNDCVINNWYRKKVSCGTAVNTCIKYNLPTSARSIFVQNDNGFLDKLKNINNNNNNNNIWILLTMMVLIVMVFMNIICCKLCIKHKAINNKKKIYNAVDMKQYDIEMSDENIPIYH